MSLRFAVSGGQFFFSKGPTAAGIFASAANWNIVNTAPAGTNDNFAFSAASGNTINSPNLGGPFTTLIVGFRCYVSAIIATTIMSVKLTGSTQTDLRCDSTGLLFFTRNGTNLGAGNPTKSTYALTVGWHYFEVMITLAIGATGSAEVRVDENVKLTLASVQTANTTASADQVAWFGAGGQAYLKDLVIIDSDAGIVTTYAGDITVAEVYPNGNGASTQWAANVGPFTLTSVNGAGVYQGTIGGSANNYVGYRFNVTGFVNGANNQTAAVCTASTATSLTLGGSTTIETHAGSAAFQCIVQPGVAQTGTRPNDDVTYISDSTAGHISEFTHDALALTGSIVGVVHQTYARKDDAGARQIQQVCKSGGTTETSSTISLGNTYTYFQDILEQDPNTSATWTLSNFNSAQFGVKEIT